MARAPREPLKSQKQDGKALVVERDLAGRSGAAALEAWLPEVRRSALRRLLRDGLVLLNGMPMPPWKKLRVGDLLVFADGVEPTDLPRHEAATARLAVPEVLFEDEACVAIAKPPGIATVPGRGGQPSLHGHLEAWFPGKDLRVVHRLDKDTSGVLVFGKGEAAARAFDLLFRKRKVDKLYLALVRGWPAKDELKVSVPIGRTERGGRVHVGGGRGGRPAETTFRVVQRFRGFALVEARPRSGRMHQVRVHLMAAGIPLAVDPLYGGGRGVWLSELKPGYQERRGRQERPLIDRLTLHAAELRFDSPATGAPVHIVAALPKDLRVTLDKLTRHAT